MLPVLYWDMLLEICAREGLSLKQVCCLVDSRRGQAKFTQAVRALVVEYYRAAATRKADGPAGLVTEVLDILF